MTNEDLIALLQAQPPKNECAIEIDPLKWREMDGAEFRGIEIAQSLPPGLTILKRGMSRSGYIDEIEAAARVLHHDEEPLTIDAANMAGRPCERRCSACDSADILHHWIDDCADEGDPIQMCKHCPAWRPYPDNDED